MFQVEPILWLQAHGTETAAAVLGVVSLLGYLPVYVAVLLSMAFAFRFRQGLATVGALLLCALLTEGSKDAVGWPRPDEVDSRVRPSFATRPLGLEATGGAVSFWSPPRAHAIAAVRRRGTGFGFPSGHVSAATALLASLAAFLRSRRPLYLAAVWVPAMALSRVYLGRHFVGDVLGGLAIGLVATGLAIALFGPLAAPNRNRPWPWLPASLLAVALAAAVPWQPLVRPDYAGLLAGLVAAWVLQDQAVARGNEGTARQRALRVLVAGAVFLASAALHAWAPPAAAGVSRLAPFATAMLTSLATFAGAVRLCRRLGLYPAG